MGGPREADERQQLAAVEAARARLCQAEVAKRAADAVRPMCAALAQLIPCTLCRANLFQC